MINLIPAYMRRITATLPTNINAALTMLLKTIGIHRSVAMPLTTHPPQLCACAGTGEVKSPMTEKKVRMINILRSIN